MLSAGCFFSPPFPLGTCTCCFSRVAFIFCKISLFFSNFPKMLSTCVEMDFLEDEEEEEVEEEEEEVVEVVG